MRWRARGRGERGVTMVESAVVSGLVFVVLFATIEFGLVFRDHLTIGDAAGAGARAGAILGKKMSADNTSADFEIIRSIRESTGGIDLDTIERIVVFRGAPGGAGSPAQQVPLACRNGSPVAGRCNVYDPEEAFYRVQEGDHGWFNCSQTPGSPACAWPAASRKDGPTPADVEYLGVWIRVRRPLLTGFFGQVFTLEDATVARIEPGVFTE